MKMDDWDSDLPELTSCTVTVHHTHFSFPKPDGWDQMNGNEKRDYVLEVFHDDIQYDIEVKFW